MKSIKRLLTAAFTAALCLAVFAGTFFVIPADKAYAADDEYTYTITVNSGKEGTFAGGTTVKLGPYKYGEECKLELGKGKLELSINDPETYRARGLKFSGHDNDEVSKRNYQSYSFKVKGDETFTVAYALNGSMVKYVVNYEDEAGNPLHPSETFFGMVGDYPVVSYQVVEGYLPDAYNKGKTLINEDSVSENVFTFVYSQNTNGGTETQTVIVNGGGNAGGGTPAGAAGQPAQFVNLDDNQTPLAPGNGGNNNGGGNGGNGGNGGGQTNIPDDKTPAGIQSGRMLPYILGGGLLAALLALIAFLRARGKDDDEEVADELEDIYINSADGMGKLSQADPEKFRTSDPDELKEAFRDLGKKE